MDLNFQQQFDQAIKDYATNNQFGVSKIPYHTHNGTDSPVTTVVDLPSGTPIKLGTGGILALPSTGASGSVDEEIQVAITSGKDQAGTSGTTTGNMQLNLEHYPQSVDNFSYFDAFRPPVYESIDGTTISTTIGGNTITIPGYSFATNSLVGALVGVLIDIYDSSGNLIETQTIASNTATVITISGTWLASTTGGSFLIFVPVYLGRNSIPWQRLYVLDGTGGGIRFGVGTTTGGQSGLLYSDASGNLNWKNYAGSVIPIGGSSTIVGRSSGSNNTTIAHNANVKVQLKNNTFASGITWDATNNRFTALTAGYYQVNASASWSTTGAGSIVQTDIKVNGTSTSENFYAAVGSSVSNAVADIIHLGVGDYVELFIRQSSGGDQTLLDSDISTFLSIAEV